MFDINSQLVSLCCKAALTHAVAYDGEFAPLQSCGSSFHRSLASSSITPKNKSTVYSWKIKSLLCVNCIIDALKLWHNIVQLKHTFNDSAYVHHIGRKRIKNARVTMWWLPVTWQVHRHVPALWWEKKRDKVSQGYLNKVKRGKPFWQIHAQL